MRVRTGHRPDQWTDNDPGGFARLSGHSGGSIHGELVRGDPGWHERQRLIDRRRNAKANAKGAE